MTPYEDLTLRQRLDRWRKTEAEKLRTMRFGKKLEYIFGYYKWWMFGLLVLILFGWYTADVIRTAQQEVVLEGFITNDDYNVFPAGQVRDEYSATLALTKDQTLIIDDTLYISLEGDATEYTAASKGKLIACMATQELDFVITTQAVLDYYLDTEAVPMLDLKAHLPKDLMEQLEEALIIGTNTNGNEAFLALDLSNCRYVQASPWRDELPQPYVLFMPQTAPHPEQVYDFLRFLYS